ncbi:MAG: hypothetical protein HYV09_15685 [Deltaproteobacteria bacterium]|nr:hypothetical protein [Deltaproteobacteria bacterium]
MPRPLSELCAAIEAVLDESRRVSRDAALPLARRLAAHMPWVHRTGGHGATASEILAAGALIRPPAASASEQALGIEPAVYSFLGAGAYPSGWLAVLHAPPSATYPDVFTAFDSGSVHRPFLRRAADPRWSELPERVRFLRAHEGSGEGVGEYAAQFIAAHFIDPLDYVRRLRGTPDHPTHHGLSDATDDRRAWTIEARCHVPVELGSCTFVAREDRLLDLPTDVLARTEPAPDAGTDDPVAATIARILEDRVR